VRGIDASPGAARGELQCYAQWYSNTLDHYLVRPSGAASRLLKPHADIYRHVLDDLDIAPAEAVFVDNRALH